jgi:2-polyprenyl-3-methyl-5-hydroxy-6-metoxy-1,4-benzoquinol methylase
MSQSAEMPAKAELEVIFRRRYGEPAKAGWSPRSRFAVNYFTPDEYYEAVVSRHVVPGCSWVDVGGGRRVFPTNPALATELAARCRRLVAVDPSDTVEENSFAQERIKARVEDYAGGEPFDLATARMVAEHVEAPGPFVAALARLLKPGGTAVVYTINQWSPVSLAAWLTPFGIHHPVKRLLWKTEEKDTYPVAYRMNTRRRLRTLFHQAGFRERLFAYLDDCRTFHRFRVLNFLELSLWRLLHAAGIRYPENCLLGVYEKNDPGAPSPNGTSG